MTGSVKYIITDRGLSWNRGVELVECGDGAEQRRHVESFRLTDPVVWDHRGGEVRLRALVLARRPRPRLRSEWAAAPEGLRIVKIAPPALAHIGSRQH